MRFAEPNLVFKLWTFGTREFFFFFLIMISFYVFRNQKDDKEFQKKRSFACITQYS